MQRLIQDTIRKALADELLFGRLTEGGRLTVDYNAEAEKAEPTSNGIVLDIQPLPKRETKPGKAAAEEASS